MEINPLATLHVHENQGGCIAGGKPVDGWQFIVTCEGSAVVAETWLETLSVGSEGRRGRWGTPTMALHIRIQHRE